MSRHDLSHKTDPRKRIVVGYDRPIGAYFVQIWDQKVPDCPVHSDDNFDPDDLESIGAVVPDGLRQQLLKEAAGETDTNVCIDWRTKK